MKYDVTEIIRDASYCLNCKNKPCKFGCPYEIFCFDVCGTDFDIETIEFYFTNVSLNIVKARSIW